MIMPIRYAGILKDSSVQEKADAFASVFSCAAQRFVIQYRKQLCGVVVLNPQYRRQ